MRRMVLEDRYAHRMADAIAAPLVIPMDGGFSIFSFLDEKGWLSISQIHRCFSIARSIGATRIVLEELDTKGVGIIQDENEWLRGRFPNFVCKGLWRISFWKSVRWGLILPRNVPVGVMLVKHDAPNDGKHHDVIHVFEAVFPKYNHPHNCVHSETQHFYKIGKSRVGFRGVMFAQQNGLSKCCAHVAIYSLLEGRDDVKVDVSFSMMNVVAYGANNFAVDIEKVGLSPGAIEKILSHYGVNFRSIPYENASDEFRAEHDYVSHVYAGVESGLGALVGFSLDDGQKRANRIDEDSLGHMIPIYGHTFNKDTWAPDANRKYFSPTKVLGYMPSDLWMSSFIAHDDNVGANLCIPKGFIRPDNVEYVVELLPSGCVSCAVEIEGQALQILHSITDTESIVLALSQYKWFSRLCFAVKTESLILRTQPVSIRDYLLSLMGFSSQDDELCKGIAAELNKESNALDGRNYWLVEVSVPQLFPANERKIADLLFNSLCELDIDGRTNFSFAHVPGAYLYPISKDGFGLEPSSIAMPLPNFTRN